jgi:hypothetical protein
MHIIDIHTLFICNQSNKISMHTINIFLYSKHKNLHVCNQCTCTFNLYPKYENLTYILLICIQNMKTFIHIINTYVLLIYIQNIIILMILFIFKIDVAHLLVKCKFYEKNESCNPFKLIMIGY